MNYLYYYILLLLIILFCLTSSLISNTNTNTNTQENFTPGIRRLYRPYVRSARLFSENFFKDSNNKLNSFLRRVGLY